MARNEREIEKEIRRIEGQLLVAKQICRENAKEINQLKKQQENDSILQETNRLLSIQSLHSNEHVNQFNKLLHLVYEQQTSTLDKTIQYNEQEEKNEQYSALLRDLSSNIAELESLFDDAKNLFTQPLTSVNMLDNTISLQDTTDDPSNNTNKEEESLDINNLQNRIDLMQKRLIHIHQCDDCFIQ